MKVNSNWKSIIFIIGVIALVLGFIDPLEGSVIIVAGSALIALSTQLTNDKHRKIFLSSFLLILFGVFFMFYFSSLGGFGGSSILSWWWILLILPYPIGWLMSVILLIFKTFKKTS